MIHFLEFSSRRGKLLQSSCFSLYDPPYFEYSRGRVSKIMEKLVFPTLGVGLLDFKLNSSTLLLARSTPRSSLECTPECPWSAQPRVSRVHNRKLSLGCPKSGPKVSLECPAQEYLECPTREGGDVRSKILFRRRFCSENFSLNSERRNTEHLLKCKVLN